MPLTKSQIIELESSNSVYEYEVEEDPLESGSVTVQQKPKTFLSNVDRTRIIKAHLSGKKPKVIAEIMDLPQRKIEVIIRHYAKTGRISTSSAAAAAASPSPCTYSSRISSPSPATSTAATTPKAKITAEQIEMLRIWANEDATLTHSQLARKLSETFDTAISQNTVQRYLGGFIFSMNRVSLAPEVQNDSRTLTLRKEFCQIHQDLATMFEEAEVIYLGHFRFRLAIRDRLEAVRGGSKGRLRQRNMSICVAMTRRDVIGYYGQNAPVEREEFQEFIDSVIAEQKESRGSASGGVLIMDESCVRDTDTDALNEAVQAKDYTILFLPPHSPFLNPLEGLAGEFRDLFTVAQLQPEDEKTLVNYIIDGRRLAEAIDCGKYVDQVTEYVPRCLASEAIQLNNLQSIFAMACEGEGEEEQGDSQPMAEVSSEAVN